MRKVFLTSGLVLCMMGSNTFAATDIDANGNVGGSGATCVYGVLDTYEAAASFDAKWTPNDYTITFAKNTVDTEGSALVAPDGTTATPSGTMADQTFAYDSTGTLTANAYSIPGYSFEDWLADNNPTNVNGGVVSLLAEDPITYIYPGNVTLTAQWYPVNSGAITLISSVYPGNNTGQTPLYTTSTGVTAPATTTVHSWYNHNLYAGSSGNTAVVAANLIPSKVGYTFNGFYDSTQTTQYINGSGAVQGAGLRAVTTGGGTDTWYANWTPKTYQVTYTCGTAPSVTGLTIALDLNGVPPAATTGTYDAETTVATNGGTCALDGDRGGYHFGGWFCNPNLSGGSGATDVPSQLGENGWALSSGSVGRWRVDSDITCRFKWAGNDYTISYDHGTAGSRTTGFSGTMSDTTAKFGSSTTLTSNAFSIPGYSFNGWIGDYNNSTGANTDTAYTNGQQLTYILPNNLSLTAQWEPNDYTITFAKNTVDTNGATLVAQDGTTATPTGTMADQTYAYDSTARLISNAYSITGYNFNSWTGDKNVRTEAGTGSMTYTNATSITYVYLGNATLTAQWDPVTSGAIKLNSNVYPNNDNTQTPLYTTGGGRTTVTAPTTETVYSVYNTGLYSNFSLSTPVVAANLIPSKEGYTFNGFYDSTQTKQYINGSGVVQGAGTRAVTNKAGLDNWYANWTPNTYTITYSCGDGTGSLPTGSQYTTATYDAQFYSPINTCTAPTGYLFTGWLVSGTETILLPGPRGKIWKYTENKTLTAQWEPKTKAINYHCEPKPNGASTNVTGYGPSEGSAVFGSTYSLSSSFGTCALPGYHPTGWDCSGGATLSNANGTQSELVIDDDIECSVHWVANNIITNWNGNVGTIGTAGSDSCDYDTGITLPSNVVRPGFVLNGWTVTNSATLPSGYTRLDYIESTGTQYIDTGVSGFNKGTWEIHAKWMITEWTSNGTIFGVYDSDDSNTYILKLQSSDNDGYQVAGNTKGLNGVSKKPNNVIHTATVKSYSEKAYFVFDGAKIAYKKLLIGTALESATNMALFAMTGKGKNTSKARIYTAWAKKDGVWQYNMIPARRDSDNVLGMYDIVNNVFRTNAGTGTFVAGPPAQ